jgi:ATP-binding cassette subfamily B multidrug efflux pump
MKNYRILKGYFAENLWSVCIGFLSLIVVDLLQLIVPRIIKWAVDDLTLGVTTMHGLTRYALYVVGIGFLIAFFRYIWRYLILGNAYRVEEALRNRLFSHIQSLSISYFDEVKTGDLMAHATNDMTAVRLAVGMGLVALADTLILGPAALAFMMYINTALTFWATIPLVFVAVITRYVSRLVHIRFEAVQATFSRLTERVRENIVGIRVVQAYNQEEAEIEKLKAIGQEYLDQNLRLTKVSGLFFPLAFLLSNLSMALVLLLGGRQTILLTITPGDFVAFNTYLALLTWPMMALGWVINIFQRGAASLGRINRILETRPEIVDVPCPKKIENLCGYIRFENLNFSYRKDTDPVLKNINLSVKPGEALAIVGRTGSGKTTLCNLVLRLYDVRSSQLFIDGHDIRQIPLEVLRKGVAYVPQDNFLFGGSIRDNIIFGNTSASEQRIVEAAKAAYIYDEIMAFPEKFQTVIGEKGITLSGGQKQRLALARALLLDTPVLILDDALSSIDANTQERILRGLQLIKKNKSLIMVTHRVDSIRNAEKIVVLDRGEIKELGNHYELLALEGIYAHLFRQLQLETELYQDYQKESIYAH